MEKFDLAAFGKSKREKLLDYKIYSYNFEDHTETFAMVTKDIAQPREILATIPPSNLMEATRIRAWHAQEFLQNVYCAGHTIEQIRAFYPSFVAYWEDYAHFSSIYKTSPEAELVTVGHVALSGDEYHRALVMIAFGVLLGYTTLLPKLVPIIDYRNNRDGLLEHILIQSGLERDQAPDACLKHLPYYKTLKIFSATANDRPALMAEYLDNWYAASRKEPYYDSHKRKTSFKGYWSWESAAITVLLNIDDTCYRDAPFYPRDLVDFARQAAKNYEPPGIPSIGMNELRTKAGDPCPKAGVWQSLDVEPTLKRFEFEQPMPDLKSAYGLTVWRFIED